MKNAAAALLISLASITASFADGEPRPLAQYECRGTDVLVLVRDPSTIEILNSECGVRMVLRNRGSVAAFFTAVQASDSDPYLCGTASQVSSNLFGLAPTIHLSLKGGESHGNYTCSRTAVTF